MNRVSKFFAALATVALVATAAYAANEVFQGPIYFKSAKVSVDSASTGNLNKAMILNRTRYVNLPMDNFSLIASGLTPAAASTPGRVIANGISGLEWAQAENTDTYLVFQNFYVPTDYASGNSFTCMVSLAAASTDTTVNYKIFKNTAAAAYDTSGTAQTTVAVTNSTTLMVGLTLPIATDTVAAGDLVTFFITKAAGTGGGANLILYGCRFEYTADM